MQTSKQRRARRTETSGPRLRFLGDVLGSSLSPPTPGSPGPQCRTDRDTSPMVQPYP